MRAWQIGIVVGLVFLGAWPAPTWAQRRRDREQQPPPQPMPADVTGQLTGFDGALVQFVDAQEQVYLAKIDPGRTSVIVSGTADLSFLRPGLVVRFTAPLDEKGNGVEDLAELTLITPGPTTTPGVSSENAQDPRGPYDVIGQIRSLKKNKLVVVAGEAQVTVVLAEEPKVEIKVSDVSWASPGDAVAVKGRYAGPGQIVADLVEVKLREPLSAGKKKKKRAPPREPKGRSTGDDAGS